MTIVLGCFTMNFAREYHNLIEDHYPICDRETAVVREAGETPNDRNDRGTISSCSSKHLFLIQHSSHPRWNRLVQHAHIPHAPTNSRAGAADTTYGCTFDR